jgi:uncharacterized protein YdaU (DUF1376 family)
VADKLLAEWFWVDRWMGSTAFLLPMEARGIYREMLSQAWRRGARLPADHEAIQRAIGCTPKEWKRSWPLIQRFWDEVDGCLVNATQQQVYAEALLKQAAKVARAQDAARARWEKQKQCSGNAQASTEQVLMQCPPSPSPSPEKASREIPREERLDEAFEQFKAEYPGHRRVDNFMTRQRFVDVCQQKSFTFVLERLQEQKQSKEWKRGLVPSMAKWFEDKHYDREPAPDGVELDQKAGAVPFVGRRALVPSHEPL